MQASVPEFLHGGGEMGARMRAFDWSRHSLGQPSQWPQSLKTIVRMVLDSRFAMWMAWGREGTFFCNDAYLPTVGNKRDWVLGAPAERVWREVWQTAGPRIEHVLTTGQATWDEGLQLFLERSGYAEETFHTFSYSPVYDDAQKVAGMLCVVAEETQRVLNERRLHLLHELSSRSTTEATSLAGVAALMLDTLARSTFDIPFAALYLGHAQGTDLQRVGATAAPRRGDLPQRVSAPASTSGDRIAAALCAAMTERAEQQVTGVDATVELPGPWDEAVRDVLVFPLTGVAQSPMGCLLLGVSTRRELDSAYRSFLGLVASQFASQLSDADSRFQAEQRAAALAELDRAKNAFFSNVSHEFRTPLTLMLGPIENLLARETLSARARDDLELVRQNGVRLRHLVNALLDFSRIEAGRAEAWFQPTDLAVLTADLASVFRSAIEAAGLRFVVHCEPQDPQPVYVDPIMWEKVVLNLLSNALKFTFEGDIVVTLGFDAASAQLTVRDTGVGIGPADLPRVFDRFHRVAGMRSRSQEGSGIGLALVKELVKLHGGTIEAVSELGRGTAFTVRVPLGKAHLPSERIAATPARTNGPEDASAYVDDALRGERTSYRSAAAAHAPEGAEERRRILVVDDNADMRAYLERLLLSIGDVSTATDGEDAWSAIARQRPDLVLTDVMMPRLDGRGLIQRIRGDPATRALPVVLLSAQAGEEARIAGLASGADDYLVKPFSAAELLARVEVQLLRAALRRTEDQHNKRLADLFRSAPVGMAVLRGPEHVFEFTNPVYQAFINEREVVGLPIREALPEMGAQGVVDLLDQVLHSGEAYRGHAMPVQVHNPASGQLEQRHFEFVYQPIPAGDGLAAGIAVICMDVDELVRSRGVAEAASRAKDEFIAMLGHELRNPLAPIFTALHIMGMREPHVLKTERELIARQARHLTRLVDDLLDVSRISRGNVELKRAVVEMSAVFRKALEMSQPLIESRRQVLDIGVPEFGLTVYADAERLAQVISNLLTNAAKFTAIGGSLTVRAWAEAQEAVLTVADTGIGMTPAELSTVFELFVQGRQDLDRAEGGLGLGLTISRNLARLHGGSLQAASEGRGKGSVFTLRLSRQSEPLALPSPRPGPMVAASDHPIPPRRVLVVDDNEDAGAALAELLEALGHEVVLAEDGPGALEAVEAHEPFDIALLDIGLPVMNGYELAQALRQRLPDQPLRLVALTGYGLPSDMAASRRSGFDEHLVKPVEMQALLASIEKAGHRR